MDKFWMDKVRRSVGATLGGLLLLALAGCYTSETTILDASTSVELAGIGPGVYCHAELGLGEHLTPSFEISEALGDNRCRDLAFEPGERRYVDARSSTMVFRVGDLGETLNLLQVQTGAGAPARYAPIAAVDGLFVQLDPAGEWPDDLVAAQGLTLEDDGGLPEVDPAVLTSLLKQTLGRVLEQFRAEISVDEVGTGLQFAEGSSISYLVWVRDDLRGNGEALRQAVSALADKLGLDR